MQRAGSRAGLLLLLSSGLVPGAQAGDPGATPATPHRQRLEEALAVARRTLSIEEFMLAKLQGIGDPGLSPGYARERSAVEARVAEARAWVGALSRALAELTPAPVPVPIRPPAPVPVPGSPEAPRPAPAPLRPRPAPETGPNPLRAPGTPGPDEKAALEALPPWVPA